MKFFALRFFPIDSTPTLSPILALALHKNPGITGDFFIPLYIIAPITIIILFFVLRSIIKLHRSQPVTTIGLIAIFLGATDNLIDRLLHNFTTDYLMFFRTSIINLADVLIIFGVLIILVYYRVDRIDI